MDELELRVSAMEAVLTEILALIDPGAVADGAKSMRERAAEATCQDDRVIFSAAAQMLEDASRRWGPPFG